MTSPDIDKEVAQILYTMGSPHSMGPDKRYTYWRISNKQIQEAVPKITKLIKDSNREARIDELKELQMSDNVHDAIKDSLYQSYIGDRIKSLSEEQSE